VMFERAEKVLGADHLGTLYLILTTKKDKFGKNWSKFMTDFFDEVFGYKKISEYVFLPRALRVFGWSTIVVTCMFLFKQSYIGTWHGKAYLLPMILSIPACFLFDYVCFAKTRSIIEFISKNRGGALIVFSSICFDILTSIMIALLIDVAFVEAMFQVAVFLLECCTKDVVVGLGISLERFSDGSIDPFKTFGHAGWFGPSAVFITPTINILSAFISTFAVISFFCITILSSSSNRIFKIQEFIDNNTTVQERPLTVCGFISIILFAIVFWSYFIFSNVFAFRA
jgi:hypothetical protein